MRCHALHQAGGRRRCTLCARGGRAGYMEHSESPDGGFGSRQQRLSTDFRWGEMLHGTERARSAAILARRSAASAAAAALSRTAVGMCIAPPQPQAGRRTLPRGHHLAAARTPQNGTFPLLLRTLCGSVRCFCAITRAWGQRSGVHRAPSELCWPPEAAPAGTKQSSGPRRGKCQQNGRSPIAASSERSGSSALACILSGP